jgi:hypothetical protein
LQWFVWFGRIEHLSESGVAAAAGSPAAAVDSLLTLDLARLDRDELLALTRGLEAQRRRLPAVEQAVLAEVGGRGVFAELGFRDTAGLLSAVLRINRTEARHRVAAAEDRGAG